MVFYLYGGVMSSKVYGASDDLLEFEGKLWGEIGYYGSSEYDSIRVKFSDGTFLEAWYSDEGIWRLKVVKRGELFDRHEEGVDPDGDDYTDKVYFKDGELTAKYSTKNSDGWEEVK
jgi:hypothetical protein